MARAAYATGGIDPSLQALLADDPQRSSSRPPRSTRSRARRARRCAAPQTARLRLAQLQAQLAQQQSAAAAAAADAATPEDHRRRQARRGRRRCSSSLKADERARLAALDAARQAASERAAAAVPPRPARPRAGPAASRPPLATVPLDRRRQRRRNDSGGNAGSGGGSPSQPRAHRRRLRPVPGRRTATSRGAAAPAPSTARASRWPRGGAAGVSLPHYSYSQYSSTRHVSRSELRPGDLLFYFGGSAHHVSMYIGGGMMVSASNPRDGVEVIAAWGPWYGERYSGAGRVV